MFAANLTLGLYVQFVPRPLTPNSTVEIVTLGGTAFNYLTLIPLLATMLFIMGRNTTVMGRPGMGCLGGWRPQGFHYCPGLPKELGSWRIGPSSNSVTSCNTSAEIGRRSRQPCPRA